MRVPRLDKPELILIPVHAWPILTAPVTGHAGHCAEHAEMAAA
eukprot:COSAG02_NODE_1888_length_10500_cov_3.026536_1_plen_42_part_10